MTCLSFPARVADNRLADPDDFGFTVTFRDLPEAITFGASESDARARTADCLWTAIAARVHAREPIPKPTAAEPGEFVVAVGDILAAKAALHLAMLGAGADEAALARRLNTTPADVRRLLDPAHPSRFDRLARALAVFRKRVVVEVLDAA